MFDKVASILNKRFKMLTLIMGVASAPLAGAQYVPAENESDFEKTQQNEKAFPQKKVKDYFEDVRKVNAVRNIECKGGSCRASIDEINNFLSELDEISAETGDKSKNSRVVPEAELKNTPKVVDFTLKPKTNID